MTIAHPRLQPDMERALGEAPTVAARVPVQDAFPLIRRHALRLARFGQLPWADAEDLAGHLLERELQEARSVPGGLRRPTDTRWTRVAGRDRGRPADVLAWIERAERDAPQDRPAPMLRELHTRAAWVQLEARSYRRRLLKLRLEAEGAPDMEAEDFTEREADPRPARLSPAGALLEADRMARALELPAQCGPALAQGLFPGDAQKLAQVAGVSWGTWRNRASAGAKLLRDAYPDPSDLADLLDLGVRTRARPLKARTLGAPLPESGDRHRTPAQSAREANVLLARPQRPGRLAGAAKLPDHGCRVLPAPAQWRPGARRVDYFLPAGALRRIAEHLAVTGLPKSGPRPHRTGAVTIATRARATRAARIGG